MRSATILLTIALLASAFLVSAQNRSEREALIDSIVREIEAGNVAVIEILRIPDDAEFRVNVNPDRLENWWEYKLTIRHLWSRPEELTNTLRASSSQPSSARLESLDLRWGVFFYSKIPEGKRLASIYFDRTGRHGAVNNISVSFGSDFLIRLKKALHSSLD